MRKWLVVLALVFLAPACHAEPECGFACAGDAPLLTLSWKVAEGPAYHNLLGAPVRCLRVYGTALVGEDVGVGVDAGFICTGVRGGVGYVGDGFRVYVRGAF